MKTMLLFALVSLCVIAAYAVLIILFYRAESKDAEREGDPW